MTQYDIIKPIGKGQFGFVNLVSRNNELYAMKQVKVSSKKAVDKFNTELDMLRRAGELGVAPVLKDSFVVGKFGYIVMEYISGPTFTELSKDPDNHQSKALQALQAFNRLHKHDILHGDANKLDNIIWDDELNRPAIIDFGMSKSLQTQIQADIDKHTRKLTDRDIAKKHAFWRGYDINHLKAKFNLH